MCIIDIFNKTKNETFTSTRYTKTKVMITYLRRYNDSPQIPFMDMKITTKSIALNYTRFSTKSLASYEKCPETTESSKHSSHDENKKSFND